jgi:hypothetical protein
MDMDEQTKKAFDFASDVTKQLIALATGVVALTISFLKDFASSAPYGLKMCLAVGWFFFLVSIILGLWTMLALTGSLAPVTDPEGPAAAPSIRGTNVVVPSCAQIITFVFGLILTIIFGVFAVMFGVPATPP